MVREREHQPIVIYLDRGKLLRANGATFLAGGGLALLAPVPWRRVTTVTRMLAILSRALLLVWGWFCLPAFFRMLFPMAVVTVDDEGISYHPPRTGPFAFGGSPGWGEIKAIYAGELTMSRRGRGSIQRFLCVLPRDEEAFLRRYSMMTMTFLALMKMQVGSPFVIPKAILPLTIDDLFAHARTQYADIIEAYGIELREEYKWAG
jgi:hypothetical protein